MTINTMKLPASTMASAYRAGRSAGQNYVDVHRETNKYAMKPDEINKAAYQAQSAEKQVATEIDARAKKADIQIKAGLKRNEIKIQSGKDLAAAKNTTRKAGIVGALGMLGGEIITDSKMGERPRMERPDDSISRDYYTKAQARLDADVAKNIERTKADAAKYGTAGNTSSDSINTAASNLGVAPSNISAQHSAGPGAMSKQSIKDLAISQGFSPQDAAVVVGIAGGESGYDPSNSTARSGLKAKTGEDSVGLMQINWGYHKDKGWLQDLGITSREQLFDPATNMKAAKYLHSGRGGFGDWTVYNEGIYKGNM